jgi:hypothetical protein
MKTAVLELMRLAVWRKYNDISADDGGSKYLWNVGKRLPDYAAQQPRRQPPSKERSFHTYKIYCPFISWKSFTTLTDPIAHIYVWVETRRQNFAQVKTDGTETTYEVRNAFSWVWGSDCPIVNHMTTHQLVRCEGPPRQTQYTHRKEQRNVRASELQATEFHHVAVPTCTCYLLP